MVYSFQLAARVLLYATSYRQYTSCGALAGPRNRSMGPSQKIDPTTHRIMSGYCTTELHHVECEKGNPLPLLHGLFFLISSKIYFVCTIPKTRYQIPRPMLHQLSGSIIRDRTDGASFGSGIHRINKTK